VLQLRRLLRALGLATIGLRADLAQRLRGARDAGLLLRFVESEKGKRALATPDPLECGELFSCSVRACVWVCVCVCTCEIFEMLLHGHIFLACGC